MSRLAPDNLASNLKLLALLKTWAVRKNTVPSQIALAWLLTQKPWIVPIPGTTLVAHMEENSGAAGVRLTSSEIAELNAFVRTIDVQGQRLPDFVLAMSGVEAPMRK